MIGTTLTPENSATMRLAPNAYRRRPKVVQLSNTAAISARPAQIGVLIGTGPMVLKVHSTISGGALDACWPPI